MMMLELIICTYPYNYSVAFSLQAKFCSLRSVTYFLFISGGVLEVVTGRGSHSDGQVARIKPAVVNLLKHSNYKYVYALIIFTTCIGMCAYGIL